MRFNCSAIARGALLAVAITVSACGILGRKEPRLKEPAQYSLDQTGCLNHFDTLLESYVKGEADLNAWNEVWACSFRGIDKLSEISGGRLNQQQTLNLFNQVLLTGQTVSPRFVRALFEMKTALWGGSVDFVNGVELEQIKRTLESLRLQSLQIHPRLLDRQRSPTPPNLLALQRAIEQAGAEISLTVAGVGKTSLRRNTLQTLVDGISELLGRPRRPELIPQLMAVKRLLFAGSADEFEPAILESFPRVAASFGSLALAIVTVERERASQSALDISNENEHAEFLIEEAEKFSQLMRGPIDAHGGVIPFERINELIDAATESSLPFKPETLKKTFRAVFQTIFRSETGRGLELAQIESAIQLLKKDLRSQTLLYRIYESDRELTRTEFISRLQRIRGSASPDEQELLDRLVLLTRTYRPMFRQDDSQIFFGPLSTFSLFHQTKINWMSLVGEELVRAYSSSPQRNKLSERDFSRFFGDFKELGVELHSVDPTVPNYDLRRFREADFYTFVGNGDGYVDAIEATYYVAFLASIKALVKRIRPVVEDPCALGAETDPLGWKRMDTACFRREFFNHVGDFWDHAPEMIRYFRELQPAQRDDLEIAIEQGSRLDGYSEKPVEGYDAQAFASVLHYVEAYFSRFDEDRNGVIDTDETLEAARIFRQIISQQSGVAFENTDILDSIYAYSVKNGRPPNRDFLGTAEFVGWMASRPFWNIRAARLDNYRIIPLINRF